MCRHGCSQFYSYCRTGDNIWSQPICAGNSYGNSIGQLKIAYCRSNPTDSRCTNYCTSEDAARDGVQSLCSSVYTDPSSGYCAQSQNFNGPACKNICTASTGPDPWGYKGNCIQVYANVPWISTRIWTYAHAVAPGAHTLALLS